MTASTNSVATGFTLALLAVAFWGGNFVAARAAADPVAPLDPIYLSFLRWLVACAVLAPFAVRPILAARKQFAPHWRRILSASFYGVTLFNTFVYLGGVHAGAAALAMVAAASPVFIVVYAAGFMHEKIPPRAIVGIVLATAGVLLTTWAGSGGAFNPRGTLWALAGAAVFAAYSVQFRKLADDLPFFPLLCLCFFVGTLILAPLFLFQLSRVGWPEMTARNIVIVGYPAVFASLGSFFAWSRALSLIGPTRAGYVYYLVPVFAAVQARIILGDELPALSLFAMAMILGGVFLSASGRREVKSVATPAPDPTPSSRSEPTPDIPAVPR